MIWSQSWSHLMLKYKYLFSEQITDSHKSSKGDKSRKTWWSFDCRYVVTLVRSPNKTQASPTPSQTNTTRLPSTMYTKQWCSTINMQINIYVRLLNMHFSASRADSARFTLVSSLVWFIHSWPTRGSSCIIPSITVVGAVFLQLPDMELRGPASCQPAVFRLNKDTCLGH